MNPSINVVGILNSMQGPCGCSYPVRYGWGTGTNAILWSDFCNGCGGRLSCQ